MKLFLTLLCLFCLLDARATIYNSNGTDLDTQSKLNGATYADTVLLPLNGSFLWTNTVTVSNGCLLNLNSSTITRAGTGDMLDITCDVTNEQRVTGGTLSQDTVSYRIMTINGTFTNDEFRLDHCNIITTTDSSILIQVETVWGCIDHCNITAPQGTEMIHNAAYGSGSGAPGWEDVVTPGTLNQVYIENCNFTNNDPLLNNASPGSPGYFFGTSAIQAYYGARSVLRFCNFYMCQVDIHGNSDFGGRWWEVYSNTFCVSSNGNQSTYCDLRAGSGVVFNNTNYGFSNLGAGQISIATDGGSDSLNYGPPGKGILILPGNTVASTNACYIWNNGPSMPIGTNGAGLSTYNTTALGGYTPAVYPHPLDTGSSSVNQYFPWKMY